MLDRLPSTVMWQSAYASRKADDINQVKQDAFDDLEERVKKLDAAMRVRIERDAKADTDLVDLKLKELLG